MINRLKTTGRNLLGLRSFLTLAAVALAFCLAGCASSRRTASRTIAIESDPTGVRVEVNGEDLGRTPTSYTVTPNEKGDFAGGWRETPSVVFTAFPPEGVVGLYKQTKVFSPAAFMEAGDRVPEKIFFDLHLERGR